MAARWQGNRVNNGINDVADLTQYMSRVDDVLYVGNLLVNSGADYEGETYIWCRVHSAQFDVSAHAENNGQGIVELIRFLWQHREC